MQDKDYTGIDPKNQDWAVWKAIYKDGTTYRQKDYYDENVESKTYEELDREQLSEFQMWSLDGTKLLFVMPVHEGQGSRLVWRRRVQMFAKRSDGTTVGEQRIYVVGKRGGFMCVLMPDGTVLADDKFKEDHALFSTGDAVDGEK